MYSYNNKAFQESNSSGIMQIMIASQFQSLYMLLTLATIGISLFISFGVAVFLCKEITLKTYKLGIKIYAIIWLIAIFLWLITGYSYHSLF